MNFPEWITVPVRNLDPTSGEPKGQLETQVPLPNRPPSWLTKDPSGLNPLELYYQVRGKRKEAVNVCVLILAVGNETKKTYPPPKTWQHQRVSWYIDCIMDAPVCIALHLAGLAWFAWVVGLWGFQDSSVPYHGLHCTTRTFFPPSVPCGLCSNIETLSPLSATLEKENARLRNHQTQKGSPRSKGPPFPLQLPGPPSQVHSC
jgi:hypothetical protein